MYKFSVISESRLSTCHVDLQRLFRKVLETDDCSIICGHRSKEQQNIAYDTNKSQKRYPDSTHNTYLSEAVDVLPYPIDYKDTGAIYMFIGYVKRVAEEMGIKVRCGADWDSDGKTRDQRFHDLGHWELIK